MIVRIMAIARNEIYYKIVIIILYLIVLASCSSLGATKPNEPYPGPYPSSFNKLANKNPLFAIELGKLPEIQDGISSEEAVALENIVELYNENPDSFEVAFKQMYQIGIPEVRKYCSPLQALFWLTEKGELDEVVSTINEFSLVSLLDSAWDFHENKWWVKYTEHWKSDKNAYLTTKNRIRWKNFTNVVDRLNAPDLLHYYINKHITYKKNRYNSHRPKHTFSHNWGDCDDLAVFGNYILRKGGYKSYMRYVYWTADNRGHVGVVIKLEGGLLLAVDFVGNYQNQMTGLYTDISEVDEKLSSGHRYHDSGWWQPPR